MTDEIKLRDYVEKLEGGKSLGIYVMSARDHSKQAHVIRHGLNTIYEPLRQIRKELSDLNVPFRQFPLLPLESITYRHGQEIYIDDWSEDKITIREQERLKRESCGKELGIYILGCPCCFLSD